MRWTALFADLEGQLDEAARLELDAEVADRTRRERARLRLVDRLRATQGTVVTVSAAGAQVTGALERVGPDWMVLAEGPAGHACLVVTAAVSWVSGLTAAAAEPELEGAVSARLTLGHVLRGIARDRTPVALVLRDATALHGTIDRVGADALDLAVHDPAERRRPPDVAGTRVVPFGALALVRPR